MQYPFKNTIMKASRKSRIHMLYIIYILVSWELNALKYYFVYNFSPTYSTRIRLIYLYFLPTGSTGLPPRDPGVPGPGLLADVGLVLGGRLRPVGLRRRGHRRVQPGHCRHRRGLRPIHWLLSSRANW